MLRSINRKLGGLPFFLLLSSLIHILAIVFPYLGTSRDARSTGTAGSTMRPASISATLNPAFTASRPSLAAAPKQPVAPPTAHRKPKALPKPQNEAIPEESPPNPTGGENLLPIPGIDYYPSKQLTVKPRALSEPVLDPEAGANNRENKIVFAASGKIILVLWINDNGNVVDVLIEESDLPEIFSQTAVKAFRELKFSPGELDGKAVGSVMRIEVRYDD